MRGTAFTEAFEPDERASAPATMRTAATALRGFAARVLACAAFLALAGGATASSAALPARMAPVEAYLMDRAEEIALARSAAPPSVSKNATVLVLTRTGYETAVRGSNGFTCMVGRGFSGASDWPERWNPKIRAAECQNPQAARSVMPFALMRTRMVLAGKSDADVIAGFKAALGAHEIPPLQAGAMSYMMSKSSYLSDEGEVHDMPHVMFFVPVGAADWGANAADAPIFGGSYWFLTPGHEVDAAGLPPLSVFLSGVANWSDGAPGPMHTM